MANNIAFQPMGKTIQLTSNSSTPNNAALFADSPSNQYRLANHASQPVYVWISPGSNPVNVVAPNASGTYAIVVPPTTVSIITGPQCSNSSNVRVSVISETGNPDLYITPGEGL